MVALCIYSCPRLNGLENMVDDQTFLIITKDLLSYTFGKDDVHDIARQC